MSSDDPMTPDTILLDTKCVFCREDIQDGGEPKLLPCLHTACNRCLTQESGSGKSKKTLLCPRCNQVLNKDEIIHNLFLLEHLAKNADGNVPKNQTYPCISCADNANASAFCSDCQEWLCENCVAAHLIVRLTKHHVIRQKDEMEGEKTPVLSQKYRFCPMHSHEELNIYCESCENLTCRDCQLSDHKGHKYEFLSKVCEDEKQMINFLLAKLEGKKKQIVQSDNLVNLMRIDISQRVGPVMDEVKMFVLKALDPRATMLPLN